MTEDDLRAWLKRNPTVDCVRAAAITGVEHRLVQNLVHKMRLAGDLPPIFTRYRPWRRRGISREALREKDAAG